MKIVHQNIRGLQSNFDIITLSETHLVNSAFNDINNLYEIPNYTFIKRNRNRGQGGGVAIYIKNNVKWERRHDLEIDSIESICLQIFEKNAKIFLLTTFYRPPSGSSYLSETFNDSFNELLTTIDSTCLETILLGDANVNFAKKSDNKDFKTSLVSKGYKQLITEPTRITKESSSIIDIIATTRPEVIKETKVFTTSISDHEMVGCIRKRNHLRFPSKTIRVRDYSKYNPIAVNNELRNATWAGVYNFE